MLRRYQAAAATAAVLVVLGGYLAVRALLDTTPGVVRPEPTRNPAESPMETPISPSPEIVRVDGFVQEFMRVRLAAHPVDRFLSARAENLYGEHATGLWLYDETLPGGPGAQYHAITVARRHPMAGRKNTWVVRIRIPVTWMGDAPSGEIVEVLTIGPGRTSSGRRRPLVVLDALRRRDGDDEGLPLRVARARHDIHFAAVFGDYEELRRLTGEVANFTYSFGESGDPIGYWRGLEEGHLPIRDVLTGVLGARFAKARGVFMWPAAAAKDPSEWTEADRQDMSALGYRKRQIRAFEEAGGFTGWRVGIRNDGSWLFFVSGD